MSLITNGIMIHNLKNNDTQLKNHDTYNKYRISQLRTITIIIYIDWIIRVYITLELTQM